MFRVRGIFINRLVGFDVGKFILECLVSVLYRKLFRIKIFGFWKYIDVVLLCFGVIFFLRLGEKL